MTGASGFSHKILSSNITVSWVSMQIHTELVILEIHLAVNLQSLIAPLYFAVQLGFVLCYLMASGLSKDIRCHVQPYSFHCLQITQSSQK